MLGDKYLGVIDFPLNMPSHPVGTNNSAVKNKTALKTAVIMRREDDIQHPLGFPHRTIFRDY